MVVVSLQGLAFLAFAFNLVDQGQLLGSPLDTHRLHQIPSIAAPAAKLKVRQTSPNDEIPRSTDVIEADMTSCTRLIPNESLHRARGNAEGAYIFV